MGYQDSECPVERCTDQNNRFSPIFGESLLAYLNSSQRASFFGLNDCSNTQGTTEAHGPGHLPGRIDKRERQRSSGGGQQVNFDLPPRASVVHLTLS